MLITFKQTYHFLFNFTFFHRKQGRYQNRRSLMASFTRRNRSISASEISKSISVFSFMCSGLVVFGKTIIPICQSYRMHNCGTETLYF